MDAFQVYLLAHTCDANHECKSNEETWNSSGHSNRKELAGDAVRGSSEESLPDFHLNGHDAREGGNGYLAANELETMNNKESESNANGENTDSAPSGVLWDVFRRQDVPKLIVYLQKYHEEFGKPDNLNCIVSFFAFVSLSINCTNYRWFCNYKYIFSIFPGRTPSLR